MVVATTRLKGIELFSSGAPDAVLIDLGLDDIDGIEVLQEMRHSSDVPILIVSARDEPEPVAKALKLGTDDYIVKPFNYRDLLARLDTAMHRSHGCRPESCGI